VVVDMSDANMICNGGVFSLKQLCIGPKYNYVRTIILWSSSRNASRDGFVAND
jgi:hypothetical protein